MIYVKMKELMNLLMNLLRGLQSMAKKQNGSDLPSASANLRE